MMRDLHRWAIAHADNVFVPVFLVLVAVMVLLFTLCSPPAHAQDAPPPVEIGSAVACIATASGPACTERPQLLNGLASAAAEADADPVAVLGALNTLADAGLETNAHDLLNPPSVCGSGPPDPASVCGWPPPEPELVGYRARVRLTYYLLTGVTYSGGHPYMGSTACSWNFRIGQRFVLPDGSVVVCNDRGLLGSTGWLDIWNRRDVANRFGPYATVEVLP